MSNKMIDIPKFHRRKAFDLMMFGYVEGVKAALPTLSVMECLIMFARSNNLTEEEYPLESARSTYNRMKKEYL